MDNSVESSSTWDFRHLSSHELIADNRYVARIFRKIKKSLSSRRSDGIVVISQEFLRFDQKVSSPGFLTKLADMGLHSSFTAHRGDQIIIPLGLFTQLVSTNLPSLDGFTPKDIEALFYILSENSPSGGGEVINGQPAIDIFDALLSIRKIFGCNTQQFHDVLKKVRIRRPGVNASPFGRGNNGKPLKPNRAQVYRYLLVTFGLTASEALLFLDYCSIQESDLSEYYNDACGQYNSNSSSSPVPSFSQRRLTNVTLGELDTYYCEVVIFSQQLPDDVAFPIVISKFVEAATDSDKGGLSGTTGIMRTLRRVPLEHFPKGPSNKRDENWDVGGESDSEDEYNGGSDRGHHQRISSKSLMNKCISQEAFKNFMMLFGGGLPAGECDLLFGYIYDLDTNRLPVKTLIKLFQDRMGVWLATEMSLTVSSMRSRINLLHLHTILSRQYGCYTIIPLEGVLNALRVSGISESVASDIEIEHIYREAKTVVELVLLIRGPIPPSRDDLLRKLFKKLDDNNDDLIPKDLMYKAYDIYLVGGGDEEFIEASNVSQGRKSRSIQSTSRTEPLSRSRKKILESIRNDMLEFLTMLSVRPENDDSPSCGYYGIECHGGQQQISYMVFSYFWGMISCNNQYGFTDDSDFNLLLWKTHNMQSTKRGEAIVARQRRGLTISEPYEGSSNQDINSVNRCRSMSSRSDAVASVGQYSTARGAHVM